MRTWNELFVRHGFLMKKVGRNEFDLTGEYVENIKLLMIGFKKLGTEYALERNQLTLFSSPPSEEEWIDALNVEYRGRTEMIGICVEELYLTLLDSYMAGMIRQFNHAGIETVYCCDGHEKEFPKIQFYPHYSREYLTFIFEQLKFNVHINNRNVVTIREPRTKLLDAAQQISTLQFTTYDETRPVEQNIFLCYLNDALNIFGPSKEEDEIRDYVVQQLTPFVDKLIVDNYGNILSYKSYGSGQGPVILLNAHLDTVPHTVEGREVIKEGNIWSSSEGPLGADDRAGVAALLTIAKYLQQSNFQGKVHFVFTVEEEIGLRGANHIFGPYLWNIDYALVLDRRGKGDIIVRNWSMDFCEESYGKFIEIIAQEEGLYDWKTTTGGSSDTVIWARNGIQSANLSIGYQQEHTDSETLNIDDAYETIQLVKVYFKRIRKYWFDARVNGRREGR